MRVGPALAGALALAALVLAVVRAQGPPSGPEPVAWNHTSCSRCGMLVGDRDFAAQLHTAEGVVHHFDDPGCLLLFDAELSAPARAVWLHHRDQDRWLTREQAGFAAAEPTPMGYGLAAVDTGEPEALGWEGALERARRRDADRSAR